VEFGVFKKTNANVLLASRYDNNVTFNKNNFLQLGLEFNQLKNTSFKVAYRYNVKTAKNEISQRIIASASKSFRIKPFDITYRLRVDDFTDDIYLLDTVRNKIQITYRNKKKKLRPFTSFDLFTSNKKRGWITDQYRAKLGVKYKLTKAQSIRIHYALQQEFNTSSPKRDFIIGTSYSCSLDKLRKKEKDTLSQKSLKPI